MKRSISIFFAAITLSVLPSCQLIAVPLGILETLAGIPINALETLGGATGVADLIPLTDEMPQPCLLYTSPSPRDKRQSRMPSSA